MHPDSPPLCLPARTRLPRLDSLQFDLLRHHGGSKRVVVRLALPSRRRADHSKARDLLQVAAALAIPSSRRERPQRRKIQPPWVPSMAAKQWIRLLQTMLPPVSTKSCGQKPPPHTTSIRPCLVG
ncbi:hypothetical protein ZWY2020_006347 [Hordeum vulgare]|nr:hypothetical protein ZWY2020_006347 [Hordeum vulgare]